MRHGALVFLAMATSLLIVVAMSSPQTGIGATGERLRHRGRGDRRRQHGLVSDCEALVKGRDDLEGSASLNWSENTPISPWEASLFGELLNGWCS